MSKPRRRGGAYPQKVRCKATNRWGEQCAKWAMKGSVVCNKHGGAAPQVRRKAQERILMAQDDAASMLVKAMGDKRIPFSERRKVAEFLLTYENRNEVKVMIEPWQEALDGILVDVGDDIVDAEIVEETRAIPPSNVERLPSLLHDRPPHPLPGPRLR
ncbi:hypothetical protein [Nocardioides sp. zg-1230]|uniref:hypothetical protein n=1 Tax=Nocardioides sp. zg-1230 TaxID=2736601 RepID=UPI0015577D68|nr:hypothetical protein [Nocardioides sp. zg-1230]NPC43125.1 hypothetical protein [Nocardioides sp. zg-1230]